MKNKLMDAYTVYTTPEDVYRGAVNGSRLGDVGTSLSLSVSVSWSLSWSWTFSWTVG
jgi:hypothetical protein